MRRTIIAVCSIFLTLLIISCNRTTETYPPHEFVKFAGSENFAEDDSLPFQFPLDDERIYKGIVSHHFVVSGVTKRGREYHAAEDYYQIPGTPVYAMANGKVSFSGPMGGYGWLVIVDHPQANIYSLYGHLSPSRWEIKRGVEVNKGELIGHLGDSDENGGSEKAPLVPHLHFAIRRGQRAEYPGMGEWRWQAGWVINYPLDMGWMQPSKIIVNQTIPEGGFPGPANGYMAGWWFEIVFTCVYLFGGVSMLIFSYKKRRLHLLSFYSIVFFVLGIIFVRKGTISGYILFGVGVIFLVIGIIGLRSRIIQKQLKGQGNDENKK
jgi:hypothetical protein